MKIKKADEFLNTYLNMEGAKVDEVLAECGATRAELRDWMKNDIFSSELTNIEKFFGRLTLMNLIKQAASGDKECIKIIKDSIPTIEPEKAQIVSAFTIEQLQEMADIKNIDK